LRFEDCRAGCWAVIELDYLNTGYGRELEVDESDGIVRRLCEVVTGVR
jgi:hypothetical protein